MDGEESGRIGSTRCIRPTHRPVVDNVDAEYHPTAGGFWRRWSPFAAWAALIISLALATGILERKPQGAYSPSSRELLLSKDLGEGLSILLIEGYYAQSWSREYILLDTLVTPDSIQTVVDQLGLQLNVSVLAHNREQARRVPYGETLPKNLYTAMEQRWGPRAVDAMDAAALIQWLVWQDVLADRTFMTMRETIRDYYQKEYPQVARKLNQRLINLGIHERIDEQYSPNREEVTNRCWELDQLLESRLMGSVD